MKKNYFITLLMLFLYTCSLNAQVVNGDFEDIKPNFLPSNWGMNHTQSVTFDPVTGQSTTDNILYTWCIPALCYASFEPQSGQYAMEISNAFNETQNKVIPGEAIVFSDSTQDSPGWNPGIPVIPGDNIQTLGFYYKFLPAGNDVAEAKISVLDAEGNQIGETSIDINVANNQYNYVYSYIYYDSNVTPAFMTISFSMKKEGSTPTFGSRLLIDNVVTNFQALALVDNQTLTDFHVYPTLADSEINIVPSNQAEGLITYSLFNTEGRLVQKNASDSTIVNAFSWDVSALQTGIYFLQIESSLGKITKKIIKK